jgi:hypothetical protein
MDTIKLTMYGIAMANFSIDPERDIAHWRLPRGMAEDLHELLGEALGREPGDRVEMPAIIASIERNGNG